MLLTVRTNIHHIHLKFLKSVKSVSNLTKTFATHSVFFGTIIKIRKQAKANKVYKVSYLDGDEDNITRKPLETLVAPYSNYYMS